MCVSYICTCVSCMSYMCVSCMCHVCLCMSYMCMSCMHVCVMFVSCMFVCVMYVYVYLVSCVCHVLVVTGPGSDREGHHGGVAAGGQGGWTGERHRRALRLPGAGRGPGRAHGGCAACPPTRSPHLHPSPHPHSSPPPSPSPLALHPHPPPFLSPSPSPTPPPLPSCLLLLRLPTFLFPSLLLGMRPPRVPKTVVGCLLPTPPPTRSPVLPHALLLSCTSWGTPS
jgi:hypothetical protein